MAYNVDERLLRKYYGGRRQTTEAAKEGTTALRRDGRAGGWARQWTELDKVDEARLG